MKLVRDKDNQIKEAKPVYKETLFLESLNKPEERTDTNSNSDNTGTGSEVELYKETNDINDLQEDDVYGEEFDWFVKSFKGKRRPLINIGRGNVHFQFRKHVYLTNQLSPRGKVNSFVV